MKTKLLSTAVLAIAAVVSQAQADGHSGGGGGVSGGHSAGGGSARGGGASFHGASARSGGARSFYSGQRFVPYGARQFRSAGIASANTVARRSHFGQGTTPASERANRAGAGAFRHGSNLPANWRNHVVAQHSANWNRGWNRSRDHWWHGHHCRFINGSWIIFDLGFYPWGPYYDDYYPYPYGYGPAYYDGEGYPGEPYNDQSVYEPGDENADPALTAAQERLTRLGYYRGEIDGVFGPATRRAVARYQFKHGLPVTGDLTANTLDALRLTRVATH
jgi:hypothetical protein